MHDILRLRSLTFVSSPTKQEPVPIGRDEQYRYHSRRVEYEAAPVGYNSLERERTAVQYCLRTFEAGMAAGVQDAKEPNQTVFFNVARLFIFHVAIDHSQMFLCSLRAFRCPINDHQDASKCCTSHVSETSHTSALRAFS